MSLKTATEYEPQGKEATPRSWIDRILQSRSITDSAAAAILYRIRNDQTSILSYTPPEELDLLSNTLVISSGVWQSPGITAHRPIEDNTEPVNHMTLARLLPWRMQIELATDWREITTIIGLFGMSSIVDRLTYLYKLAEDDPDEKPIVLESLRRFAIFLMSSRRLSDPQIGTSLDGFAHAVWRVSDYGILAMDFLPSGNVRFAAIIQPQKPGDQEWSVDDVLPPERMMRAIEPFIELMG